MTRQGDGLYLSIVLDKYYAKSQGNVPGKWKKCGTRKEHIG